MKSKFRRDVRRPMGTYSSAQFASHQLIIDEEFKDIINRQCPGKLTKLIKQRAKTKHNSQPFMETNHSNSKQLKVFEKTFFKQRQKTAEKQRRVNSMRLQLHQRLKMNERPPSPFFKLSRANILGLQRHSLQLDSSRIPNKSSVQTKVKSKSIMHPYIRIISKTGFNVSKKMNTKFHDYSNQIIEFSPFGSIQPVDIHY